MKTELLDMSRFKKKEAIYTHEGAEVVAIFGRHIELSEEGRYGYTYHLRKVKECGIKTGHAEKIVSIMLKKKAWLKTTADAELHCGKWLTNRYQEIKDIGIDRYISKNS